ncbi:putative pectinesterase 53 [Acorus calamus]|uniref:pectinesterase n=1 Tax=Acorus calamus TaxID=4465 RepID=A0AAV9FJW2_ACOCL|nr:putative pectinesterase 53 [Acorus calamus]
MHGPGNPSVALRVSGDKVAFCARRFTSYQDTLFDHRGRHYCRNCYIEGATDYASYTLFLFLIHEIFLSLSPSAMDWVKSQKRTRWIHGLSYKEAAPFLAQSMINGQRWLRWPKASHFKCACTHIAEKMNDD